LSGINEKSNSRQLPSGKKFTQELDPDIPGDVLNDFHVHLLSLLDSFNCYFPEELHEKIKGKFWVVNSYSVSEKPACLTSQQYECLFDLTLDSAKKVKFATKKSLSEFSCQLKDEFKVLSDKAKIILLPFATTYVKHDSLPMCLLKQNTDPVSVQSQIFG